MIGKKASYSNKKRERKGVNIDMRPLCKACGIYHRAINYHKGNKTYYRSLCEACMSHGSKKHLPRWFRAGYKPKNLCEKCGYKSGHSEIFRVFHIDGNLDNCRPNNLKTVCCNCAQILGKEGIMWRQGDLVADY
jgi:hypothetical protein